MQKKPLTNSMTFFTEPLKAIIKFIWKHKRPVTSKAILSKRVIQGVTQKLTSNYTAKP
jgi:hypothetical protein